MTATDAIAPAGSFVHLHLHSEYSLLDGGNTIDRLLARVKELGMDAVAVTDHGNLYGAMEFYTRAREAGVKPILGIEAYVAPESRLKRESTGIADGGFHLVLLAENDGGWRNLVKLSSDSFLQGFYYKPRMDKTTLAQWRDGLIAINGHLGSSIAHHLLQYVQTDNEAHYRAAVEEARWHAEIFGVNERGEPRFYIELQRHDVAQQQRINPHLLRLARELNLPIVADNDAHFLRAEDWDHHDSLCCISMAKAKDDRSRLIYSRDLYVKSHQQMAELFTDLPEAIENTRRIADRCNVALDFAACLPVVRVVHPGTAPSYDPQRDGPDFAAWFGSYCARFQLLPFDAHQDRSIGPEQLKRDCDRALRDLCEAGLPWRYGPGGVTPQIRARLDRELAILSDKNISAYFLIVWDFVNWARQRGIPATARGSGVGTMVGYVLGLSNACPEKYGLLFERFTDPDRSEYPDIDIDICQDGRAAVIQYVRGKYGHVAQIITFGRLKAKAAIKDVARVMGLPPGEGQRLANFIPEELHITIDSALEREPDLRAAYDSNEVVKRIVDTARALEGHARHAGVHAAGVVIATQPLDTIIPLCKTSGTDDVVTQWDGPTCEQAGLLKMDFLGLRTLSTIELAKKLIRETLSEEAIWRAVGASLPWEEVRTCESFSDHAHPLDLDRLTYDDQRVLALFCRGDTSGVFQFESGGMRKLLMEMRPDRLEDLIAANALYRPGPMDLIPAYNKRKHGQERVPSLHPLVDQYTAETYGIMVYQEQVMQIVHGLGDIPLRAAYTLIKAISKKKSSVIDAERPKFIDGAKKKGLNAVKAGELFDLILKFAGYGFNKSHSTGYAIIAYQTAYLKTYFPNQYMAAVLTYESAARKVEDWVPYLEDCRRTVFADHGDERPHIGVEVRPPDINLSDAGFSVVFLPQEPRDALHGHVRFGLGAIKGAGQGAIEAIIAERRARGPFTSIFDLCERIDPRTVPKSVIESLVKCGALDSLHGAAGRAAAFNAVADAIASGLRAADDRRSGQLSLMQSLSAEEPRAGHSERRLPATPPWDHLTMLAGEKDTLGFHVSGHPLDQHEHTLRQFCTANVERSKELADESPLRLGGVLTRVRPTFAKTGKSAGQRMAMITIQDKSGSIDGVVFSDAFARCGAAVQDGAVVIVVGRVDRKRGEPNIIVDRIFAIDEASRHLAARIELDVIDDGIGGPLEEVMASIAGVLRAGVVQSDPTSAGSTSGAGGAEGANGSAGNGGSVAEVLVNLYTAGRCVTLRSKTLRAVADRQVLGRLHALLGMEHVRVTAGGLAPASRSGHGRNGHGAWNGRSERGASASTNAAPVEAV